MKKPALQFALREMRGYFRQPAALGILIGLSLVLGIAGPFGTTEFMRLFPRLAYWVVMTFLTFTVGTFIHALFEHPASARSDFRWQGVVLAAFCTGLAVAMVVFGVNWVALGVAPIEPVYLLTTGANALIIAIIISVTIAFHHRASPPTQAPTGPSPPPILDRLPPDKRGNLVSMSVQDHYVEVTTTKGPTLILMRLADAITETAGQPGMQVHRSHWVANQAVVSGVRKGDRAVLTLNDGRDIPVSRTYLTDVKDAGLLSNKKNVA